MAAGGAGVVLGQPGPQYNPFTNTWTYKGGTYAQYGDALASDNPPATSTSTTGSGSASLPPSMQSLSNAGSPSGGVDDATAYIRQLQALDAQRSFSASQAALDRAQQTSMASGAQAASAADAALDRAQQTSMSDMAAQHAKELAAQEAGFESAAAKEAYERTAQQAALDRAFQTSTIATGVGTSRENQDRMMQFIMPFLSSFMGTGGTSGTADGSSGTAGGTVTPPGDDDALAQQASTAAFNRAKDQTADLARSSLMTLRSAAAERGVNVAGGTNPALLSEESRTLQAAQQPLADLTRQQAIDTSTRANAVADRNYQGNITLQGQKASLAPSLLSLLKVGGLY